MTATVPQLIARETPNFVWQTSEEIYDLLTRMGWNLGELQAFRVQLTRAHLTGKLVSKLYDRPSGLRRFGRNHRLLYRRADHP